MRKEYDFLNQQLTLYIEKKELAYDKSKLFKRKEKSETISNTTFTLDECRLQHDIISRMVKAGNRVFSASLGIALGLSSVIICISLFYLANGLIGDFSIENAMTFVSIIISVCYFFVIILGGIIVNDSVSNSSYYFMCQSALYEHKQVHLKF